MGSRPWPIKQVARKELQQAVGRRFSKQQTLNDKTLNENSASALKF
jgi:hypothetical protein